MAIKWIICNSCEGVGRDPRTGQECANCKGKGGWFDVNQDFTGWNLPDRDDDSTGTK